MIYFNHSRKALYRETRSFKCDEQFHLIYKTCIQFLYMYFTCIWYCSTNKKFSYFLINNTCMNFFRFFYAHNYVRDNQFTNYAAK